MTKVKVKDLIEVVATGYNATTKGYTWKYVRGELENDEKKMVYQLALGKILRIDYPELQEYNPKDGKWHECLESYNTINTREDLYKFCKFKETTNGKKEKV